MVSPKGGQEMLDGLHPITTNESHDLRCTRRKLERKNEPQEPHEDAVYFGGFKQLGLAP